MKVCKVIFTDFMDSYSFSINLFSHYTTIIGFNSGEGKTWMFDSVSRKQAAGELRVDCEYDVIFSTLESLERDLDLDGRVVIITDEYTISKSVSIMNKINNCKHIIIAITRASVLRANSPLNGIYRIVLHDDSVFDAVPVNVDNPLNLTRSFSGIDIVVTEAAFEKSEHQFISGLCEITGKKLDIVAAGGKDKIAKKLRQLSLEYPNKGILVFMDLGNVSSQFKILKKRCADNQFIKFFDYTCFEELLVKGSFFREFYNLFKQDVFDFLTPEKYYEKKFEIITSDTPFAYRHKNPKLSLCYLIYCMECTSQCGMYDDEKLQKLLDSDLGIQIYDYFFNKPRNDGYVRSIECF